MSSSFIEPPSRLIRLLRRFCPPSLLESIEGDLLESYQNDVKKSGGRMANWILLLNILRFFRWEIISRQSLKWNIMNIALLLQNLKITIRSSRKHFGYTFINLAGLATGIAVCFLIYSYTRFQLSYDQFFPEVEKMYRVNQTNIWSPEGGRFASTAPPLAARILDDIPGVESVMRINTPGGYEVQYQGENQELLVYREEDVLAADSNFFDFFPLPFLEGNPIHALREKNQAVITRATAEKYLGKIPALGKIFLLGPEKIPVQISGVLQDLPRNMHFDFDILLSMSTNPHVKQFDWSWVWTQVVTYIKLKPGADPSVIESGMTNRFQSAIQSTFERVGMNFSDFMKGKGTWSFSLQPVKDIHLMAPSTGNRLGPVGDIKIIRILQIMAVLILIIAVINFINLSTARASIRNKEIGVKKTMGATAGKLARQFQSESVILTLIASVLSIPIILLMINYLSKNLGIELSFDYLSQISSLLWILIAIILIGFISGFYPSLILTRLNPVLAIKQQKISGKKSAGLRHILVTLQFGISLAILSGGLLIGKQLRYVSTKDLGFARENILVVHHAEKMGDQLESFRSELDNLPVVNQAAITTAMPGRIYNEDIFAREGSDLKLAISQLKIDAHFLPALEIAMKVGRNYTEDNPAEKSHVIINETTARLFGWTAEEALSKKILYPEFSPDPEIIGVVEDFHFQTLYENIRPLIFFHHQAPIWGTNREVVVKFEQENYENIIALVEQEWKKFGNQTPFDYSIFDEELHALYNQDRQLGALVNLFSYLCVFIAILGLLGLVAYTVELRKKEIGVRKVLGAGVGSIFLLINRFYLPLFMAGLLISIPVTWYVVQDWLQNFAFRIQLPWQIFLLSGLILITLCLLSVGFLTYRAIRENPVQAIRDE